MIKKAFNTVYEYAPWILLIWLTVCLILNDYQKAAFLVGALALLTICDSLNAINRNLLRIANNTDLTTKDIVVTELIKRDEKPK
ncbi:hypothetical protein G15_3448 [Enterococcus avium]|nr:hypothetical protein G15_3448 [Enterococcus avium]